MSPHEPYASGMISRSPPGAKIVIRCRWVAVVNTRRDGRGLTLIHPRTRVVRKGDVHEIICTDEEEKGPGDEVNRVATWGWAEFLTAGVVMVGDAVWSDGQFVGTVVGFDETHLPNHINVIVSSCQRRSGVESGFVPDGRFEFRPTLAPEG